ncbi:hypothetical protein Tco_1192715, partial [Tanacetum coccineum]
MTLLIAGKIKGRFPVHLSSSAGDGTHHGGEKELYVEKVLPLPGFLKSLLLLPGKSQAVCIPQMMGGLMG